MLKKYLFALCALSSYITIYCAEPPIHIMLNGKPLQEAQRGPNKRTPPMAHDNRRYMRLHDDLDDEREEREKCKASCRTLCGICVGVGFPSLLIYALVSRDSYRPDKLMCAHNATAPIIPDSNSSIPARTTLDLSIKNCGRCPTFNQSCLVPTNNDTTGQELYSHFRQWLRPACNSNGVETVTLRANSGSTPGTNRFSPEEVARQCGKNMYGQTNRFFNNSMRNNTNTSHFKHAHR